MRVLDTKTPWSTREVRITLVGPDGSEETLARGGD